MAACRNEGFPGLRVAVDMSWALRPVAGVEQLPDFEEQITAVLAGTTVSVLCQYDRERFDPVTLATVTAFHTRSVAAATYHADAVLRICRQYAPPGIRLAGEIDHRHEEPLALALAEAIRLEGDITVHMAGLVFSDASCPRMTDDARRPHAPGRRSPGSGPLGAGAGTGGGGEPPVLDQVFDNDSLYALRAAVAAHGSQAGLADGRVGDLVLAVHELAANAVRHGAGLGRVRIWNTGEALRCEVTDDGPPRAADSTRTRARDSAAWHRDP